MEAAHQQEMERLRDELRHKQQGIEAAAREAEARLGRDRDALAAAQEELKRQEENWFIWYSNKERERH